MSFEQLGLAERITKAINELGYAKPMPIQQRAIPKIVKNHDLIGIAQTGTGKTAAFTLPILSKLCQATSSDNQRHTKALIIAPTRELVHQIHENIRKYAKFTNLRTVVVTGGASEQHQIEKLQSNADIVIATPGRLLALQKGNHCQFGKLEFLVLDEADRMLDMGFLPDIIEIIRPLPNRRQTLLFSATLPKPLEKLAADFMEKPEIVEVGKRSNTASTIEQFLYPAEQHLKTDLLIGLLDDHNFFSVLVFVRTRDQVAGLAKDLQRAGIDSAAMHGEMSQNHRSRTIRDFRENKIRVLVATDIAARGLDIDSITHVVNFDFPESNEDYIHRIGRTGRAGATGHAITFNTAADQNRLAKLEKHIGRTIAVRQLAGFNYNVPAPEEDKSSRFEKPQKVKPKRHSVNRSESSKRFQSGLDAKQNRTFGKKKASKKTAKRRPNKYGKKR